MIHNSFSLDYKVSIFVQIDLNMKFGFRAPSFKRSLSAMTRGAATRALKKTFLPGYGQKGKSYYTGFEKSAYNKVYNLTTVSIYDLFKSHKSKRYITESDSLEQLERNREKLQAVAIRKEGLNQCDEVVKFLKECGKTDLNKSLQRAIHKVDSYYRKYIDKGVLCGENLYTFANRELNNQKETAIKGTTQYECEIAIDIISQLKQKTDYIQIIETIKNKYIEKTSSELPNRVITYPEELTCNPNAVEEGKLQLKIFDNLSNRIASGSVYMPAIHIKLLNLVIKYYGIQKKGIPITLYDFFEYELTQKLLTVKRDITKFEYHKALEIVNMLKSNMSVDEIYGYLKKNLSCDSL